jgi:hypothetical protein
LVELRVEPKAERKVEMLAKTMVVVWVEMKVEMLDQYLVY